jgi:hypothetical protein
MGGAARLRHSLQTRLRGLSDAAAALAAGSAIATRELCAAAKRGSLQRTGGSAGLVA